MSDIANASGTIWAVFGHRLAIDGPQGRVLADLGPKGAEGLALAVGDAVTLTGMRKPSEIAVSLLTLNGGEPCRIDRPDPKLDPKSDHGPGDPVTALRLVREAGYRVAGKPKRKPKHYEIVGVKDSAVFELHVHRDGSIRKIRPVPTCAGA